MPANAVSTIDDNLTVAASKFSFSFSIKAINSPADWRPFFSSTSKEGQRQLEFLVLCGYDS